MVFQFTLRNTWPVLPLLDGLLTDHRVDNSRAQANFAVAGAAHFAPPVFFSDGSPQGLTDANESPVN